MDFKVALTVYACLIALVVGTAVYWSRQPVFPIYGYIFIACLIVVMVFTAFNMRRWRTEGLDEFQVAKKRMATQIGFIAGFVIYSAVNILPFLFRDAYNTMFLHLDGPREGFILGQVAGMAPFVLGLFIGHIVAWAKFR